VFQRLIARKVAPVSAQIRTVAADVPHVGANVGAIPVDIPAVVPDVGPAAVDIRLLVFPTALLGVLVPQVGSVRADIADVIVNVTAVVADIRLIVGDVTLVRRDIPPVGIDVRLQGAAGWLAHVDTGAWLPTVCSGRCRRRPGLCRSLITREVAPVGTHVRTVFTYVLHVRANVGAIPVDVLAVVPDVGPVAIDIRLLVFPGALLGILVP